jgi:hypothetical protein
VDRRAIPGGRSDGADAFDRVEPSCVEPGEVELRQHLVGVVEVRRREPARAPGSILVSSAVDARRDEIAELLFLEEALVQPVDRRREARDHCRADHATGEQDAARFAQRLHSIVAVRKVIERPEEQHGVKGCVVELELAGITQHCRRDSAVSRLCDV